MKHKIDTDLIRHAAKLFFGANAIFSDLPIGAAFRFPTNGAGDLCRKTSADGWYRMVSGKLTGRRFQTGRHTAVITAAE